MRKDDDLPRYKTFPAALMLYKYKESKVESEHRPRTFTFLNNFNILIKLNE